MAVRRADWVIFEDGVASHPMRGGMSGDDLADLLEEAEAVGFDLTPGSAMEEVTVRELKGLVNPEGHC